MNAKVQQKLWKQTVEHTRCCGKLCRIALLAGVDLLGLGALSALQPGASLRVVQIGWVVGLKSNLAPLRAVPTDDSLGASTLHIGCTVAEHAVWVCLLWAMGDAGVKLECQDPADGSGRMAGAHSHRDLPVCILQGKLGKPTTENTLSG